MNNAVSVSKGKARTGTPRSELARLKAKRDQGDPALEQRIMEAMLLCAGDVGYRRVAVNQVYQRYGGYRSQFYRHFLNKAECFVAAYEMEANRIADKVVAFAEAEGPPEERLSNALEMLADLIVTQPTIARALFIEVHVAGGEAREKRQEVMERLSHALDRACRETRSRHSPPPLTGEFMINAIDQAVSNSLLKRQPESFRTAAPELAALVCATYSGKRID